MIQRVTVCGKVKPLGVAVAKASPNRANKSRAVDPKPVDLSMTRLKERYHALEARTVVSCKLLG